MSSSCPVRQHGISWGTTGERTAEAALAAVGSVRQQLLRTVQGQPCDLDVLGELYIIMEPLGPWLGSSCDIKMYKMLPKEALGKMFLASLDINNKFSLQW